MMSGEICADHSVLGGQGRVATDKSGSFSLSFLSVWLTKTCGLHPAAGLSSFLHFLRVGASICQHVTPLIRCSQKRRVAVLGNQDSFLRCGARECRPLTGHSEEELYLHSSQKAKSSVTVCHPM